jgi:trimeric autotransporter adhesin
MKQIPILSAVLFAALLAVAETAAGQQPPDVVNSDARQNTAMGTGALLNLGSEGGGLSAGNTASGYQALYSNTEGYQNAAFGEAALFANTTGSHNTASGAYALYSNSTGIDNAAALLNLQPQHQLVAQRWCCSSQLEKGEIL